LPRNADPSSVGASGTNRSAIRAGVARRGYSAQATRRLEKYYDSPDEAARNVVSPSWEAVAGLLFSARCFNDRA